MNWPAPSRPDGPPLTRIARRWWWVPVAVLSAGVFFVLEFSDADDDVNPAIVEMVGMLESQKDCPSLQEAFDRSDDRHELRYIDESMERAGCYD